MARIGSRSSNSRSPRTSGALWHVLCIAVSVAFVVAGWWLSALALNTPALPTPDVALGLFVQFAPTMGPDFAISFGRIAVSLLIGTVLGVPAGLWLGQSSRAGQLLTPALYILYPLPKIVLLPILLVLLGLGSEPKIALISLTVFFQVVVVMRDAAKNIPEQTILSVRSLGGSRWDEWRHVILPATLPDLFTTLRVSSAIAIAVLFFAEAIAGSTGIGYFIMNSWAMVNYPRMFAGIIALALLGVIVYEAFDLAERRLTRWKR
ncbi:MAG: ABC transporter permease subunit [Coriobacteriia bacterium]|nr:ABC transporter permease subunit [Coriobacteriia bacterium]